VRGGEEKEEEEEEMKEEEKKEEEFPVKGASTKIKTRMGNLMSTNAWERERRRMVER